jgi:hypothetical protein
METIEQTKYLEGSKLYTQEFSTFTRRFLGKSYIQTRVWIARLANKRIEHPRLEKRLVKLYILAFQLEHTLKFGSPNN